MIGIFLATIARENLGQSEVIYVPFCLTDCADNNLQLETLEYPQLAVSGVVNLPNYEKFAYTVESCRALCQTLNNMDGTRCVSFNFGHEKGKCALKANTILELNETLTTFEDFDHHQRMCV